MSWDEIVLGSLCSKIGSGATPKGGATVYIDKGTSFIRSQNVYNMHFSYEGLAHITENAAQKLKGVSVQEHDVLINITGDSVARTCVVPSEVLPARVSQHVAIIRTERNVLDPYYLNYYLASPYMQAFMLGLAVGKGASRNAMTKDMISGFKIPCPPIDIQKRISDVLTDFDNLIENNQKQIKLLEEAAQRLYKEWFVDLRFPGHENVKIIDGVPEGWKVGRADNFFDITIGKTPPRSEKQFFVNGNVGVPWVSIADMGNSETYIFKTSEGLTHDAIEKNNVKVVPEGTILVSFKLTLGRVSITTKEMCTNEAIAHFRINDPALREYTYSYLKYFKYDTLGNTSSISKAVNSKIIKGMPFVMPNGGIVQLYSKIVSPIFNLIQDKQALIVRLSEARDRLLPKLMSGEIEL